MASFVVKYTINPSRYISLHYQRELTDNRLFISNEFFFSQTKIHKIKMSLKILSPHLKYNILSNWTEKQNKYTYVQSEISVANICHKNV